MADQLTLAYCSPLGINQDLAQELMDGKSTQQCALHLARGHFEGRLWFIRWRSSRTWARCW